MCVVNRVQLGDLLDYEQPTRYIISSTDYDDAYDTPVLTAGQTFILGYTNETEGIYKASKSNPVIIFDDFVTSFYLVDFNFKVKSSALKILKPKKNVNIYYVYYAMLGINFVPKEHARHWISKYSQFEIAYPSLAKQQEIVSQLDTFTTLISNLESELDMRRKQYEHYRNQLLDFEGVEGVEWKPYAKIGTITDYVSNGSFADLRNNVEYKQAVDYAILVRTVDFSTNFDKSKLVYIDEKAYNFLSKSKLFGGEIIINNIGAGVGSTFICPQLGQPMSLAPNAIMLNTPNNKFYYYWFVSKYGQDKMMSIVAKSAMPKFNKTGFKGLEVPIPSSETQQQIVEKLDAFEQLIQSLETEIKLRKQQYEYYREKLLTFEK